MIIMEKYIWTLWWQGEENAPELVKKCFINMKKYSGGAEVVILDECNYRNYVDIPEIINEKFKEGKITITHLSDIIRFLLLDKYGGLWLDSTIYVSDYISDDMFNYDFFSIKNGTNDKKNISQNRWTSFLIGGKAGNVVFKDVLNMFIRYWENNDELACYFLIDFYLNHEYKNSEIFRDQIDLLPDYKGNIFEMAGNLKSVSDMDEIKCTGIFQKLNWRFQDKISKFKKINSLGKHIRKLFNVKRLETWGIRFVIIDFLNSLFNSYTSSFAVKIALKYNKYVENMNIYY